MKTKLQNRCSVGVLKSCRSKAAYLHTIILFLLYFVELTYALFPPAYMFKVIQDKSQLQSVRYNKMERVLFVFELSWATRGNITHCLYELGLLCMRCQHYCLTRQRKCFCGKEAEHSLSPLYSCSS